MFGKSILSAHPECFFEEKMYRRIRAVDRLTSRPEPQVITWSAHTDGSIQPLILSVFPKGKCIEVSP